MTKSPEEVKKARHEYYVAHRDIWLKNAITNKEANDEHKRLYALRNPEKIVKSKVEYALRNLTKVQEYQRQHYQENKVEKQIRRKQLDTEKRELFLKLYGGKCSCCGESQKEFLAIDHIKGQKGIPAAKKELGVKAYRAAIKNYDPETYRILCHNCNFATRYEGAICPHQLL
jgi:DNA-nicking Smr family endonuclease